MPKSATMPKTFHAAILGRLTDLKEVADLSDKEFTQAARLYLKDKTPVQVVDILLTQRGTYN